MTSTQPRPNISTEHQADGDARHPSDTLDREPQPGRPQEKVEDRPSVGQVKPEDYPEDQRSGGENNLGG